MPRGAAFPAIALILLSILSATLVAAIPASAQTLRPQALENGGQSVPDGEVLNRFIDVLRDEKKREALIQSLKTASGEESAGATAPESVPEVASFGRQVATYTQEMAESAVRSVQDFWQRLKSAPAAFAALDGDQVGVLLDALKDLALVIVTTYAIFLLLRQFAKRLYLSIGNLAATQNRLRLVGFAVISMLIDAGAVILAWTGGYIIALTFFGAFGSIGLRQTLYLNAFLIVELIKVVLRFALSPTTGELRLVPLSDAAANKLTRGFTAIITLLGYGQLLIVPIFNQNVSFAAGRSVSLLIALIAVGIAAAMTMRNRKPVSDWLLQTPGGPERNGMAGAIARRWHVLALCYLAFLAAVVLTRPGGMLFPVLNASFQVFAGFVVGFAVSGWIAGTVSRGIMLPEEVNRRLPLLERRLNTFIPQTLTLLRGVIFVAVVAFALHTVGLVDVKGWLQSQIGVRATSAVITVTLILTFAFVSWLALTSWVDYRTNPEYGKIPSPREQTLLTLLKNAATIAIIVLTLMVSLSEIGIDIAPLIASAGVLGLAIGFGAQKLVQDIITGIFIQLENAINVGDVITVSGTTGTAERLTIRSVGIRDLHGSYHIIPFSSVDMVTNFMRDFAYHVCDMGIAYREDQDEAKAAMFEAFEILRRDEEFRYDILGDMEWHGLQQLGDSAVILRARIKTMPGKQWAVGRAFNGILKKVFDEKGIEIPFPHQTIYFGEDKHGRAPAAYIRLSQERSGNGADARPEPDGQGRPPAEASLPAN
ncbi:mechanosensitive ion channel [Stappia sp. F7233]|uniref:Mechanosensitive ion channel n=2 Tax=Stappia albiluteola TaxID=2758565 RepID=A0A839AA76_9HYPH|nr:mechanosensitive ion channel [Stappia albiluteola]